MKVILSPVDFSEISNNAALYAANLAEFYGADLWLYHAYELPVSLSEYAFPLVTTDEMQKAADHELEELKKMLLGKLRRHITINTKAEMNLLQTGLNSFCEEIKPDITVIGLSGGNALTKLIVGSNTISIIHYLKYPVLVVPPKAEFIRVRKIGFACNYYKVLKTTPIGPLKKIVHDFGAELHVMNIGLPDKELKPEELQESQIITELLHELRPEFHIIQAGDITDGINWFVDNARLDMVVMIPKKHNMVGKVFSRSHTKEFIFHTHVPVLCMHE